MIGAIRTRFLRFVRRVRERPRLDPPLIVALLLLAAVGLVVLYSAGDENKSLVIGQALRFALGGGMLILASRIPPALWRTWTPWIYGASVALLLVVALAGEGRGATRWLDLGVMRFQPSEILKLSVPMMVAWYLHPRPLPPRWRDLAMVAIIIAVPAGLIADQPDLGTALLVVAAGLFALFLSGLSWWRIGALCAAALAALPVAWHFLHDYQRQRVLMMFNPAADPLGSGWHIIQSKIAVGSGGLLGKGWHHGTQSRLEFLPEHTTDFIFAVLAEEFGLIGVALLLVLYGFIVGRSLWIALQARDTYSRLLGGAIAMSFSVYVLVNGGMITGVLPVVGVPLPLVSYGGTSAVALLTAFGVLLSAWSHRKLLPG